jgi:hypothetical protein
MYSVGDRVMVDGESFNLRYEGVVTKVAENEKNEVMYLILGDGGSSPFWQKQDAVYLITKTK